MRSALPSIVMLLCLSSCGYQTTSTTESDLSSEEIRSLEKRVSLDDTEAIRALELHYDFSDMPAKREEMHQKLLSLNDPMAMLEEAEKMALRSENQQSSEERIKMLEEARLLAERSYRLQGFKDPHNTPTLNMIDRALAKER